MDQSDRNDEVFRSLNKALRNNGFQLLAQPIHTLNKNKFAHPYRYYELLVQMLGKDGEIFSSDEFVPVAEYFEMMPELDRWVVREAFKHIALLKPTDKPPLFAINISGQSLDDEGFCDFVVEELKRTGIDARMICFEITESVAANDLSLASRFISSLKAQGSRFTLDQFGTGVSSYGYLTFLDVDCLKIADIYAQDLMSDSIARNIVESVTQVGHSMKMEIIANGVDDENAIALLQKMGADYGQGDAISKPMLLEDVIAPYIGKDTLG